MSIFLLAVFFALLINWGNQLHYGEGALALYAIETAVYQCSLTFSLKLTLGVLCHLLVCLGVRCNLNLDIMTLGNCLGGNLRIITIGNMIYGVRIGVTLWRFQYKNGQKQYVTIFEPIEYPNVGGKTCAFESQ